MFSRTSRAALLALGALMVCGLLRAQVFIPATEAVGPPPTVDGTGLNGFYFFVDINFQGSIVTNANAASIAAGTPTATYTATSINYGNSNDLTPVHDFLNTNGGTDGDTLNPLITAPTASSVFDMKGFLSITDASFPYTFALNSDDGSLLTMGKSGITVVDDDGDHAPQQKEMDVTFEAPGLYPVEILFYNDNFQGGTGGMIIQFKLFGAIVDPSILYPAVP